MAPEPADTGRLTEQQRDTLDQYTSLTHQDGQAAVSVLQRSAWDVQIAVSRFFDGEAADVTTEDVPPPLPRQAIRHEALVNGFSSTPRRPHMSGLEPATRVVVSPDSQGDSALPAPVYILFSVVFGLFARTYGYMKYFFPFLPRLLAGLSPAFLWQSGRTRSSGRRPLNGRDTAARFIREFGEEYGSHQLPFLEDGYAQAFDKAKAELKFLLVLLLSSEHDDTSDFVRETILSEQVVSFINDPANQIILWAGSVQDSEAYQVSSALNCTKFPFVGLIVHTPAVSSTAMSVAARVLGPVSVSALLSQLQAAIAQNTESLQRVRAQRAEQQATQDLRQAQNSAYERSLARDRERARQRREADSSRQRREQEERERSEAEARHAESVAQWRRWRRHRIMPEPLADESNAVSIRLRMPAGGPVIRRFMADARPEEIYAFVECYDHPDTDGDEADPPQEPKGFHHEYGFHLVSPMPRTLISPDTAATIKDLIGRNGTLIVEAKDEE